MDGRATIRDIARAAGVSTVTVSRVANASGRVAPETRARVEAAMARLGYVPNLAARAMRTRATRTVGFLLPHILSFTNAAVAQAAERALAAAGYGMLLVSAGDRPDGELAALALLARHRVDGLLVYPGAEGETPTVAALRAMAAPVVVLDRTLPLAACAVLSDHAPAMRQAVGHLRALGHRRILLMTVAAPVRPVAERKAAFLAAMADAGDGAAQIAAVPPGEAEHFRAGPLLAGPARPTAVIAAGRQMLRAAIEAARDIGLAVPRDLSLIGVDVEDVAPLTTPELTRISRDYGAIGTLAVRFLLDRLGGAAPSAPRRALLPCEVVLKASCGPAP